MEIKGMHTRQAPALHELARSWERAVDQAEAQLAQVGQHGLPNQTQAFNELRFAVARFVGARDELRRTVSRIPMEVGETYDEDQERLAQAVKALERAAREVNTLLQMAGLPGVSTPPPPVAGADHPGP